jgi:Holliday junction resolvasome RuvABC endonuclease subunit
MKYISLREARILAIDPSAKGFGFAVLEGPEMLVDWGIKAVKGDKNAECLKKIAELIELYKPQAIVVENPKGKGSQHCLRVQQLIQEIIKLASSKRIKSRSFSRSQIRKAFSSSGAFTKHQIATEIAKQFLELESHLPRIRKPWMSEDARMSIFDALALAVTLFYFEQRRNSSLRNP